MSWDSGGGETTDLEVVADVEGQERSALGGSSASPAAMASAKRRLEVKSLA